VTATGNLAQCWECPACATFSDSFRWRFVGDDVFPERRCPACGTDIAEDDMLGEKWGPVDERGRLISEFDDG
jgi:hypothetical protein